MLLSLMG